MAYCQKYYVVLLVAVMIGFGKGLRTVFMALVIPTHVPLHKLPGASGIQLITAGMVYLSLGPVVGKECLNSMSIELSNAFVLKRLLSEGSFAEEKDLQEDLNDISIHLTVMNRQ